MSTDKPENKTKDAKEDSAPRRKRRRSRQRPTQRNKERQGSDKNKSRHRKKPKPTSATKASAPERDRKPSAESKPKVIRRAPSQSDRDEVLVNQDYVLDPLMATISQSVEMWGEDKDAPEPDPMVMPSKIDQASLDPDPSTFSLKHDTKTTFRDHPIKDVVGARPHPFGRTVSVDIKDHTVEVGDRIVVKTDKGSKVMTVFSGVRRIQSKAKTSHFLRVATDVDEQKEKEKSELGQKILLSAKSIAKTSRVDIKLFRSENLGSRVVLYYSAEESPDVRGVSRLLAKEYTERIELRQTGVREQAKSVGGIGSCGMELCCSKWLPSFAPVSIKHAKDQGLSLNSSKISGKCGRLKCCLVYEHSTYAEMRKGLPKLGKRVITAEGEGRVIEVDVLKQKVRVRGKGGNSKVYLPSEVEPMFPSQQQKKGKQGKERKGKPREEKGDS